MAQTPPYIGTKKLLLLKSPSESDDGSGLPTFVGSGNPAILCLSPDADADVEDVVVDARKTPTRALNIHSTLVVDQFLASRMAFILATSNVTISHRSVSMETHSMTVVDRVSRAVTSIIDRVGCILNADDAARASRRRTRRCRQKHGGPMPGLDFVVDPVSVVSLTTTSTSDDEDRRIVGDPFPSTTT